MLVAAGQYRTLTGLRVDIVGPHPRLPGVVISDQWDEYEGRGAYWYETGVHPHNEENDLVEQIGDEATR